MYEGDGIAVRAGFFLQQAQHFIGNVHYGDSPTSRAHFQGKVPRAAAALQTRGCPPQRLKIRGNFVEIFFQALLQIRIEKIRFIAVVLFRNLAIEVYVSFDDPGFSAAQARSVAVRTLWNACPTHRCL